MRPELASLWIETPAVSGVTHMNRENSYEMQALHIQCSPERQMLSTLCSLTVIEEIIHPIIWKHTHFILCYGWCWGLEKQARFTEERTRNDLRGFGSKCFPTWEACRYLGVLVAKPITAISHLFPSLRDMWLLKIITLFPQKSAQAILETRVVLSTKDVTYTFTKFAVKKVWCFPEAWYERPHQREPGSNKPNRLLRAMNKQIKPLRVLGHVWNTQANLSPCPPSTEATASIPSRVWSFSSCTNSIFKNWSWIWIVL